MKIKVGISNRHIHLTKEDFKYLFGKDELTIKKKLSQDNNFASFETVTIKTSKNSIPNVRVLGPFRNYTQVEISKTDSIFLGINPPVRDSGDLIGAAQITIVGPLNELTKTSCIIATRHIHLTKELKEKYNLTSPVKVKIDGEKSTILENIHLKLSDNAFFELHLDTDDANASLLKQGDEVKIIR